MISPLRRVLVRRPSGDGDWAGAGWRTPDAGLLARQHEAFCELLAALGVEVEVAAALDGQVDSVYMHDPLVMTGRGGIALRMAKPARRAEPGHAAEELERLAIPVLGKLVGPACASAWRGCSTASARTRRSATSGSLAPARPGSSSTSTSRPGTPPETMIVALEELNFNVPGTGSTQDARVRGDIVYFPTANGGAVWSASSIAYCGALAHYWGKVTARARLD